MSDLDLNNYQAKLLSTPAFIGQLKDVVRDYETILIANMQTIADRFDKNPAYNWVDTKINLITGEDFVKDDGFKGPDTVYGWIQARAIEALVGHAAWLEKRFPDDNRAEKLRRRLIRILSSVLHRLDQVRRQNGGHLFFFLTTQGQPFIPSPSDNKEVFSLSTDSPYNFSDLFGAKAMYAAAQYINDNNLIRAYKQYCLDVDNAVWQDNFRSDQAQLDANNPITFIPNRYSHTAFMIQIGTACLLAQHEKDTSSIDFGLKQINHIL
ncbi:MAG: hypothetical protein JW709_13555, partial [Sedimentisphaerales bacterium]|nr:hypothetical protein [Sedimentisphaerales bacterium]